MRTLFIVCPRNVNKHAGENYDSILEVPDQPTTENIGDWANRIKDAVRALWGEQVKAGEADPKVHVWVDAQVSYLGIMRNLCIRMKPEEGVAVEMPGDKGEQLPADPEALDLLRRLGDKA